MSVSDDDIFGVLADVYCRVLYFPGDIAGRGVS